ncbi:hypothetical protein GGI12_003689, partial [Dipsacomyces acuminosporus]
MSLIDNLLALTPDAVKQSLDQDTLDYLGGLLEEADASDPSSVREAAEPFLVDAGMPQSELDSLFARLCVSSDGAQPASPGPGAAGGPALLPSAARLPKAQVLKDAAGAGPPAVDQRIASGSAPSRLPAAAPRSTVQKPTKAPEPAKDSSSKPPGKQEPAGMKTPAVQAYSRQSRFHNETVVTLSKDVDLRGVNVTVGDVDLLVDARLWLKAGYHYGFVGRNGVGKSTLLSVIGNKTLVGFPENIRTLYVQQLDVAATGATVLDAVLSADEERQKRIDDVQAIEGALHDPAALRDAVERYVARIANERIHLAQKTATLRSGKRGRNARAAALNAENNMVSAVRESIYAGGKQDSD